MAIQKKSLLEFTVEELDRELIARGSQISKGKRLKFKDRDGTPARKAVMEQVESLYHPDTTPFPNEAFSHISMQELVEEVIARMRPKNGNRGLWNDDDRMDCYELTNGKVKKNVNCVAAVCLKKNLTGKRNGSSVMQVKNYGKSFNLCDSEPYHQQPAAAGLLYTGFLVKEDIIATAAHCTYERNVTDLRIVFGFKMSDPFNPVTRVSDENIYKGVEIIHRVYDRKGSGADWALVRLDRKVEGQEIAKLSKNSIFCGQPVYVIGHPNGLPLKYSAGARVRSVEKAYFGADLDVYSGNSGSPVFNLDTHEVIGILVHGDNRDFRYTGDCWLSVIYPNHDLFSKGPQCTRITEIIDYCREAAE